MNDSVNVQQATKICSHCQTSIPLKATKCPQCQADLRSWINRNPLSALLLVFLALPFILSSMQPQEKVSPEQAATNAKTITASRIAKEIVKSVPLKAPSTAKYRQPIVTQDTKDLNLFVVESYLDSENGFGAMIRTNWSMKLKYIGTGTNTQEAISNNTNWKTVEFIFDGEKVK